MGFVVNYSVAPHLLRDLRIYVHGVGEVRLKLHTPESWIWESLRNRKNFVGESLVGSREVGGNEPLPYVFSGGGPPPEAGDFAMLNRLHTYAKGFDKTVVARFIELKNSIMN
jgi:hypothetical protein